jgi:hypothetical protein
VNWRVCNCFWICSLKYNCSVSVAFILQWSLTLLKCPCFVFLICSQTVTCSSIHQVMQPMLWIKWRFDAAVHFFSRYLLTLQMSVPDVCWCFAAVFVLINYLVCAVFLVWFQAVVALKYLTQVCSLYVENLNANMYSFFSLIIWRQQSIKCCMQYLINPEGKYRACSQTAICSSAHQVMQPMLWIKWRFDVVAHVFSRYLLTLQMFVPDVCLCFEAAFVLII